MFVLQLNFNRNVDKREILVITAKEISTDRWWSEVRIQNLPATKVVDGNSLYSGSMPHLSKKLARLSRFHGHDCLIIRSARQARTGRWVDVASQRGKKDCPMWVESDYQSSVLKVP